MALLTTHSNNTNKVESTGLCVRYSVQLVDYTYYQVTRTATKEYAYTGMTRAAAESCKLAKIAQYTRPYYKLSTEKDSDAVPLVYGYTACKAQVSKTHGTGDSWNVTISVSEEDTRAVKDAPTDPASLFSSENARDYDETAGVLYSLTVNSSTYNSELDRTTIVYSQNILDFDRYGLVLQYKDTESQQAWSASSWSASGAALVADGQLAYVRLVYGTIVSPVVQTTQS